MLTGCSVPQPEGVEGEANAEVDRIMSELTGEVLSKTDAMSVPTAGPEKKLVLPDEQVEADKQEQNVSVELLE